MALESAADFNSYVNNQIGSVSATFFEVQSILWDQRTGLIDAWFDIDSGDAYSVNIILDQDFFNIQGNSVAVEGYQPKAMLKSSDVPYISQSDKLIVDAVTTNNGSTLTPETTFLIKEVHPDNVGMVTVILEAQ
tara:strand:- start:2873 stop:3274 length:402 start_codon:yes stop_codon:yes gene_type:complete